MLDIDFSKFDFHSIGIRNDLDIARNQIVQPILMEASCHGYSSQDRFALRLGLEEAICNAYRHGNKRDPQKTIHARWVVNEECAIIFITDEGEGFHPDNIPDPRAEENLEKPSGRGVMLMKAYMNEIRYNPQGNEVCLIKLRKVRPRKISRTQTKD
jgi:serine/threonine-protein kinase RsbW